MIKDITTTTTTKKKKTGPNGNLAHFHIFTPRLELLIKEDFNRNEALVPKNRPDRRKQEY